MKRLKIWLVVALISTLIAVFAMVGCNESKMNTGSNTLNPNIATLNAKGGLQVSLNFIKKSMSTKASDISDVIDSVTFHITGANLPAPINQTVQRADFKGPGWAVIQINDLLPGTINVTVEAKDASGNVIATGHQDNITVIPGDTIRIRIDCVINVGSVIIDFVCINCLPTPTVTIPASISPPSPMPTLCCPSSQPPTSPPPTDPPPPTEPNAMAWGMAVTSDNNYYYLADEPSNRILKYTSSGIFQSELQHGFNSLCYVAVDSSNNLYVADTWNHKIQKFTSSGVQSEWNVSGSDIRGIAVDNVNNHVYVVDYSSAKIYRFNLDGTDPYEWANVQAIGIAVDPSGNVYVADTGSNRIQKFDSTGVFINKWGKNEGDGSSGNENGEFSSPYSLAVDSESNVYVADYGNSRVQKFNSTGGYLGQWPVASAPMGIAVDSSPNKNIYVTFWTSTNPPAVPVVQKISQ